MLAPRAHGNEDSKAVRLTQNSTGDVVGKNHPKPLLWKELRRIFCSEAGLAAWEASVSMCLTLSRTKTPDTSSSPVYQPWPSLRQNGDFLSLDSQTFGIRGADLPLTSHFGCKYCKSLLSCESSSSLDMKGNMLFYLLELVPTSLRSITSWSMNRILEDVFLSFTIFSIWLKYWSMRGYTRETSSSMCLGKKWKYSLRWGASGFCVTAFLCQKHIWEPRAALRRSESWYHMLPPGWIWVCTVQDVQKMRHKSVGTSSV